MKYKSLLVDVGSNKKDDFFLYSRLFCSIKAVNASEAGERVRSK